MRQDYRFHNFSVNFNDFSRYVQPISPIQEWSKIAGDYQDPLKSIREQVAQVHSLNTPLTQKMIPSALSELSRLEPKSRLITTEVSSIKQLGGLGQGSSVNLSILGALSNFERDNIPKLINGLIPETSTFQSHLTEILKFSIISRLSLSHFALEDIGKACHIKSYTQATLKSIIIDLENKYSNLLDSFNDHPDLLISLPPIISRYPSIEFFNAVRIAEIITVAPNESEQDDSLIEEIYQLEEDIRHEAENELEQLLEKLNPNLLNLLNGARQSLTSNNPDKTRHFITSLRELFTHVLHTLSPDEKIKEWSNSPEDYSNGKPTRKARLLYICSPLNHKPFTQFVTKDIETALKFVQLFNRGTHELISPYTDFQLRMMLIRMELTLRFLIEIWKENNH